MPHDFKTQTREIGGLTISVTEMDFFAQQDLWIELAHEIEPGIGGLGGLLSGGLGGFLESQEDISSLAPALSAMFRGLSGQRLRKIQHMLFASTQVLTDGKLLTLSDEKAMRMAFGPKLATVYEAMVFAAGVIFDDFLSRLAGWLSAAKAKAERLAEEGKRKRAAASPLTSPAQS